MYKYIAEVGKDSRSYFISFTEEVEDFICKLADEVEEVELYEEIRKGIPYEIDELGSDGVSFFYEDIGYEDLVLVDGKPYHAPKEVKDIAEKIDKIFKKYIDGEEVNK